MRLARSRWGAGCGETGGGGPRLHAVASADSVNRSGSVESSPSSELAFRSRVVRLGAERASALLADVKRRLEQVIAGA